MIVLTIIATFFAAMSAVAAFCTVLQARDAQREAIKSNRPYFTLKAPGIKQLPNSPPYRMQITMENIGVRVAQDLKGKIIIVDMLSEKDPTLTTEFSIANDIPKNVPTPWYTDSVQLPSNVSSHYVLMGIKYLDPITKEIFKQSFFMKWNGIKDGKLEPDFVHVSCDEKEKIIKEAGNLLSGYLDE